MVPRHRIARIESDHEALLEAQGLLARPGPVAGYKSRGKDQATERVIEPYGILIGIRRYLIARSTSDPNRPLRHYVAEKVDSAELTGELFERDPEFNIDQYARRGFGAAKV